LQITTALQRRTEIDASTRKDQRSIAHDDLVRRYRLTPTHNHQRSQQIYTDNKDRAIDQCLKNDLTRSVLLSICRVAAAVSTRSRCPANHQATRLAKLISMVQNVTRDGVSNGSNASPPALHLHRRCSPQRFPHWIVDVEPRSHGLEHVQLRTAGCHNQTPAHPKSVATPRRIAAEENVTNAPRNRVLGPRTFNQATNLTRRDTWLCHATDTANAPDGQSSPSNDVILSHFQSCRLRQNMSRSIAPALAVFSNESSKRPEL
jgi:hypothetical protein